MPELVALIGTAVWLGILTSISPCPLASNIAAISYIGRDVQSTKRVFLMGLLYALGRSIVYVALAAVLVGSLVGAPGLSQFLQKYINMALGPVLVLAGMILLGLLELGGSGRVVGEGLQRRVRSWGLFGALALGVVFALSFCPVSAGLFFVSLVPIAVKEGSPVLLPLVYGVGTALPVIGFALGVATGARWLGAAYNRTTAFARGARVVTGLVFVVVGVYLSLIYVYGL
ncbi:MAG: aromatic aminobenezylarsenical efflux permease ArsG family transporter [Planctomycetota bacterium]|nr:aromatic aminobenezylarsenical efflux permease ArsG family transporter [Planctomycetota bacterium]